MRLSYRLLGLSLFAVPAYVGCATSERIGPVGLGDSGSGDIGGQTLPTGTGGGVANGGFTSTGGQAATGGVTETGGATGSGGVLGGGGAQSTGGSATGGVVGSGGTPDGSAGGSSNSRANASQKTCNGACVTPSPSVGCDLTSCTPCPAGPTNGFSQCDNGACSFGCFSGFVPSGSSCVTPPTCTDRVQNGNETAVDCGGGAPCSACPTGDACKVNSDCANGPCTGNVCACMPKSSATIRLLGVCQDVPSTCVLTPSSCAADPSESLDINELEPLGPQSDTVRIVLK